MTEAEMIAMYEGGATLQEVVRASGFNYYRTRKAILSAGVMRDMTAALALAVAKGRKVGNHGKHGPHTQESRNRMSQAHRARGEKYAVGVSLKPNGYLEYTRGPHKGRGVHRVLAEEREGRPLSRKEHVHHIDHDKLNNSLANLVVMPIGEHVSLHRRK